MLHSVISNSLLVRIFFFFSFFSYQVRYGLLQAGHYGAPQRRVRFFLIAAAEGQALPELPQPTHEFPVVNLLQIKHPKQDNRTTHTIRPIRTTKGTAAHPFVTIESAIGDLPRFDWYFLNSLFLSFDSSYFI